MDLDKSPLFGYLDFEFPFFFDFALPGPLIDRCHFSDARVKRHKCKDLLASASYCLGL